MMAYEEIYKISVPSNICPTKVRNTVYVWKICLILEMATSCPEALRKISEKVHQNTTETIFFLLRRFGGCGQ